MREAAPPPIARERRGAVVLCGGRSTRMGRDKASLPFGRETLLERVVRIVADAVAEVVVVARPGQELPPLPDAVRLIRDEVEDRGPLGGLGPGLRASRADAVFATACDAPFVSPRVIDVLFSRLGACDVAVAETDGFTHPLCAVYRTKLAASVERLVAEGRLRPVFLYDTAPTVRVPETELRTADEELRCLVNCNTPEAYEAALAMRRPSVSVELFDVARKLAGRARLDVEAASLGDAMREIAARCPPLGRELAATEHWRFSLNGARFVEDPATPLADGDSLLVLSAQAGG
jgi:molybdopterin-guanine dinucleotide biosynthesis protein A